MNETVIAIPVLFRDELNGETSVLPPRLTREVVLHKAIEFTADDIASSTIAPWYATVTADAQKHGLKPIVIHWPDDETTVVFLVALDMASVPESSAFDGYLKARKAREEQVKEVGNVH